MHSDLVKSYPYALFILLATFIWGCSSGNERVRDNVIYDRTVYTPYSEGPNAYLNFDAPRAINALAKMENHYFRHYTRGISPFYGTVWREYAELDSLPGLQKSRFDSYRDRLTQLGMRPDSMHCTLYAVRALEAGMGANWKVLEAAHRSIWKEREHAGWSLGYLLVRDFGWRAFLLIDRDSREFDHCLRAWQGRKTYPVWRQPEIPLSGFYIRGENDSAFYKLLAQNEFGWGFSEQGIHTWITRFGELKECNWQGAPGQIYAQQPSWVDQHLFLTIPIQHYQRYLSHVVIFAPRGE
ncbi:MAG: hypothetical protein H6581_21275 [Bacteroidia bacterium]|nr:hypothetical protein [Bacteroidia bacterium]